MNNSYQHSIKQGQKAEDLVADEFTRLGYTVKFRADDSMNLPHFDMIVCNGRLKCITVEVKSDSYNNSNAPIETCHNSQPSGIKATKADVYVFYKSHTKSMYIVSVDKLRSVLKKYPVKEAWHSGSKMHLVDLNEFDPFNAASLAALQS